MCSATMKKKINTDFSSSNQNSVQLDPTEKRCITKQGNHLEEHFILSYCRNADQQGKEIIKETTFLAQKVSAVRKNILS